VTWALVAMLLPLPEPTLPELALLVFLVLAAVVVQELRDR
jgi:hypothetical protein